MQKTTFELPRVQLGAEGPWIGSQGLGCMGMSEFYGATDTTEARATLKRALSEALRQVADLKPKELLEQRYKRLQGYGRFADTKER